MLLNKYYFTVTPLPLSGVSEVSRFFLNKNAKMKATIKPQNVSHSENFPALSPNKLKYVNTFWKQFDV